MRLIIFLFSLIIFTGSLEAQEKKTAALAPLASMGDLDEIQKNIIFNSLQESLSKFYTLTSTKMYERAEEEAFQQMEINECTEAQCIAIIQELLQVEYFFMFQILKSNDFQQLKLTRVDLDANRDVRTDTCSKCDISKINSKVNNLVLSINEQNIPKYTSSNIKMTGKEEINLSGESAGAVALWEIVKNKDEIEDYRMFIEKFPNSSLTIPAEFRINEKLRIQKEIEEQKRKEKEKKERQAVSSIKNRWSKAQCKKNKPIIDNYYLVYSFVPYYRYGINENTGEIVSDVNQAIELKKEEKLIGNGIGPFDDDTEGHSDGILKLVLSSASYIHTVAGISSAIFNTSCYDTYENGNSLIIKYASFNSRALEEEISGETGQHLSAILSLRGCDKLQHKEIRIKLKENYSYIYNQSTISYVKSKNMLRNLEKIIYSNPWLKASCNAYSPVDVIALN